MERIKISTNFYLDEFIDPMTYFSRKDNGLNLIDKRLFDVAQLLRYHYLKPLPINTWWFIYKKFKNKKALNDIILFIINNTKYGNRKINKWSGTRGPACEIGAINSAHKFEAHGRCLAIDPKGDQNVLFNIVKQNAKVFYNLGVRRLEDPAITPGWLHLDLLERNTRKNSIRVVNLTEATQIIKF